MQTTVNQKLTIEDLLSRLKNVVSVGDGWSAGCPAHEDKRNSLSIDVGDDGRFLLNCHAGCETPDVVAAVGLTMADLFPNHSHSNGSPPSNIVDEYEYHDAEGALVFKVVRREPKRFSQCRPDGNGGFIQNMNGVSRVLYRLPELLKSDASDPVFIVEGEKDADRLGTLGLIATTNVGGGAVKWNKSYSKSLTDRHVVILPDNDPTGLKHAAKVAAALHDVAASVKVLQLPGLQEKGDVSDWLSDGGTKERLIELASDADTWQPSEKPAEVDLIEAGDDPHRLARVCLERLSEIRRWRDEFFIYDQPAYRALADDELRAMVTAQVKGELDRVSTTAQCKVRKVTRNLIADVIQAVESMTLISYSRDQPRWLGDDEPFPAIECFVTPTGIIHPPSLVVGNPSLVPPTPQLFTTCAVDYAFEPEAECPLWEDFLSEMWPTDTESISTLQDIFGYLLLPDTSQQKAFLLIGPKRSGKGTIARVMRGTIGERNVCAPTLGSLAGEFGLQPLLGKTVAIVSDARLSGRTDDAVIVERVLSITGEDAQTVNRKYKPAVTTKIRARFVLLSNELPTLRDASATLPSRIIVLQMTRSFYGFEDRTLTDRLLAERPGILRWSLTGWQRLQERGKFVQPKSSDELLESMEELSSPVLSFVRQCCEIGPEFETSTKDIFERWTSWCEEKGRKNGTEQSFGKNLRAAVPSIRRSQRRVQGKQVRHYIGLKLSVTR